MKKRTFLTTSVVVMLILSLTSRYITPASACVQPDVEIWKEFMETSDPPPYHLGTEYHWDIEIGVWTSVDLKRAKVYDRFGAELKIDTITTPDGTYTFTYPDYEEKYPTRKATVTINGEGPYKLNWRGVTFGEKPYKFRIYWTGKTHKIHFRWYIGNLEDDETITIIVGVSTDLNPCGKQQYTSPCEHCINSGAVLKAKWKHRCRWRWVCAGSDELCIKVQCEEPLPAELILDKFNDTNGNGIFDAGDYLIEGWAIDVMDPHGVPTTYLTPRVVEITDFGTYVITEDLPAEWEQTALRVDGDYETPAVSWTMTINEGETHDVLYGNKVAAPPPAKLIIQKFNDTDGDGVFDEGIDNMITGWEIYVMDPDAVTTTHSTPISLDITNFGTYIITEDLPDGWEQTAVAVDGVPEDPPTLTVAVEINPGDERSVLYGNQELFEAPLEIHLWIDPRKVEVPGSSVISWEIEPGGSTPVSVTFTLYKPDGSIADQIIWDTPPIPMTGTYTASFSSGDEGTWTVTVVYTYEEAGVIVPLIAGGTIHVGD